MLRNHSVRFMIPEKFDGQWAGGFSRTARHGQLQWRLRAMWLRR